MKFKNIPFAVVLSRTTGAWNISKAGFILARVVFSVNLDFCGMERLGKRNSVLFCEGYFMFLKSLNGAWKEDGKLERLKLVLERLESYVAGLSLSGCVKR